MNTCDSCKWWELGHAAEYGRYGAQDGSCVHPKMLRGYGKDVPVDGAVVEDDEGYGIVTGPKFGCVNWEAAISKP